MSIADSRRRLQTDLFRSATADRSLRNEAVAKLASVAPEVKQNIAGMSLVFGFDYHSGRWDQTYG